MKSNFYQKKLETDDFYSLPGFLFAYLKEVKNFVISLNWMINIFLHPNEYLPILSDVILRDVILRDVICLLDYGKDKHRRQIFQKQQHLFDRGC